MRETEATKTIEVAGGQGEGVNATPALAEAARQMNVCNACRYCEGLCAVFPAMEKRQTFTDGDINYLANLCHNCSACYYDCQYVPPHEFAVNVPVAMAEAREESYAHYAWPRFLAPVFERNGLWIAAASALFVAVFIGGFALAADPGVFWSVQTGEGAFYRIMPHEAMAAVFGAVFFYAIFAIGMGVRAFWLEAGRSVPIRLTPADFWRAMRNATTLRYLDGGGAGCMNEDERPSDRRRLYHHATFYGFLLCFASTSTGTLFHYGFGWEAPYPLWSPVVILGTLGGIGLVVGPIGLLREKHRRDPAIRKRTQTGMDAAFLWSLLAVSATGLALLALRASPAMGLMLSIHLGVVFALFLSFPYGKFVHGIYRYLALVRHAAEEAHAEGRTAAPSRPLGAETAVGAKATAGG